MQGLLRMRSAQIGVPIHSFNGHRASLLGLLRSFRGTCHLPKPLPPKAPASNRVPLLRFSLPERPRHRAIRTFLPLTRIVDHGGTKSKPDGSSRYAMVDRSHGLFPPVLSRALLMQARAWKSLVQTLWLVKWARRPFMFRQWEA